MAIVSHPPHRRLANSVFLAGSIEMGKARDWQAEAIKLLDDHFAVIYNPRRPDWDSSWEQSIQNVEFRRQVDWELDMIAAADWVLFNFEPDTIAPISLMELGSRVDNVVVCCPDEYFRKGNVDIFCYRHKIPVFLDLDRACAYLKGKVEETLAGSYHQSIPLRYMNSPLLNKIKLPKD